MNQQTIRRGGKTYVLVEQGEYERLTGARGGMPALPLPGPSGSVDAVGFARATIARQIIGRRQAARMTQTQLAEAAGVRVETLNRIENAKHTADVATLAKIDAALPAAGPPVPAAGHAERGGGKVVGSVGAGAPRSVGAKSVINTGTERRSGRRGKGAALNAGGKRSGRSEVKRTPKK